MEFFFVAVKIPMLKCISNNFSKQVLNTKLIFNLKKKNE